MIELVPEGVYLLNGVLLLAERISDANEARENTIAYSILRAHNRSDRPDKCASNSISLFPTILPMLASYRRRGVLV